MNLQQIKRNLQSQMLKAQFGINLIKRGSKMRKYYGIRFHGGNRTCTTGEPNPNTGRMSIACSTHVFNSKDDLDDWIDRENLCKPSGLGGGERISITKKQIRDYCLGMTIEEYNEYWEF